MVGLWRYPVKGLLGERLQRCEVDGRGLVGDRAWAVVGADGKLGSGKTTRRFRRMPGLFTMSARTDGDDVVVTVDGWSGPVDETETARRVSAVVGEPVTLQPASTIPVAVHDEGPVHVLTTAAASWIGVDARRFRPNLIVAGDGDGPVEDDWVDHELRVGEVGLRVTHRMPRCAMTSLAQPLHDLPFDPGLVGELERRSGFFLGVCAEVVTAGVARVDDAVGVLSG